jgi:hypothetical protein
MSATTAATADATAIRPFHIDVPEEALDDLRRRIAATRLPEKETVADASQGVQFATIEAPTRYWATTSRPGRSRSCSRPRYVRPSGRFAR